MAGSLGVLPAGLAASTTSLKMTSMAGPLGALSVGPTASTTEVADDVDGGPPEGAAGGSGSVHHRV
jgi:hypothetical protein